MAKIILDNNARIFYYHYAVNKWRYTNHENFESLGTVPRGYDLAGTN
jgi:hypothetical protein